MGYAPSAYVVDLEKLAALYASKNTRLAEKIISAEAKRVADNTEWFAEKIAEGAPRIDDALREIVAGKCTKKQYGFQYAYALELACRHLGKVLGSADYINWAVLDALQELLPKQLKKLLSSENATDAKKLIVRIPRPADFPGMGHFDTAQCKEILPALKALRPDPEETYGKLDGEELAESLAELIGWFGKAVTAKRGLMLFTY